MINEIPGQLNQKERETIIDALNSLPSKPEIVIEVGTWLGGGSTFQIIQVLSKNNFGHLYGIEADKSIYEKMIENIRTTFPNYKKFFTPVFGLSQNVLPDLVDQFEKIDFAFLDGGNNPFEQILEFKIISPKIPVGGKILAHDAKLRKGKWLVPYVTRLDNWKVEVLDISEEGLLYATKIKEYASPGSVRRAELFLLKNRLNPIELIGNLLPSGMNVSLLKLLPEKIRKKIAEGR